MWFQLPTPTCCLSLSSFSNGIRSSITFAYWKRLSELAWLNGTIFHNNSMNSTYLSAQHYVLWWLSLYPTQPKQKPLVASFPTPPPLPPPPSHQTFQRAWQLHTHVDDSCSMCGKLSSSLTLLVVPVSYPCGAMGLVYHHMLYIT